MKLNLKKVLSIATCIIVTVLFLSNARAQKVINTIAGNSIPGYSGNGGPATNAKLYYPAGVALDDSDNVYIADQSNFRIRKIYAKNGIIVTIAGTGADGYTGDGGPALLATLSQPADVFIDIKDNVYIADANNNCIRKIDVATGIITTVAGNGVAGYSGDNGQATDAELNSCSGLVLDDSDNIFISDRGNNRVRKVRAATGIITSIVGNGNAGYAGDGGQATDAELYSPQGITLDHSGNIYIVDNVNSCVRKISESTGIITTITGDGHVGFSGDGGPATDAVLFFPQDAALDDSGNIYISDQNNNRIREIRAATGIINTIAGNGIANYSGDGGPPTDAELNYVQGVKVDTFGNVYIVDNQNNRIREITSCNSTPLNVNPSSITTCEGVGVTLTVNGGSGFSWSPSTGLNTTEGSSVIATPASTTTYTVTNTNSGCGATGMAVVTVIASPNKPTFRQHGDTLISTAEYDNQWYRNDTLLINDTSQYLIITKLGEYRVNVTNEANGCSTSSDSVSIVTLTGINQFAVNDYQVSVYPNPFNSIIHVIISSPALDVKDGNLQITDMLGRTLFTKSPLNYMNDIDLTSLPNGMYFMTIINNTGKVVVPVVRQN